VNVSKTFGSFCAEAVPKGPASLLVGPALAVAVSGPGMGLEAMRGWQTLRPLPISHVQVSRTPYPRPPRSPAGKRNLRAPGRCVSPEAFSLSTAAPPFPCPYLSAELVRGLLEVIVCGLTCIPPESIAGVCPSTRVKIS
jgi:hypothetical protein